MTVVSVEDTQNGKTDLDNLGSIVNGSTTVTTRYGGDKLSVSQALSQIVVGEVTTYSAATTYSNIEDWVEYNGVIYRPLPSALPVGPEAFDASHWAVAQGLTISDKIHPPVSDYATLKALDSSSLVDGTVIPVTDDGIAGHFIVKTGTVTDDGGVRIVFSDDSNRYAERKFEGPVWANWWGLVSDWDGSTGTDNTTAFQSAVDFAFDEEIHEVQVPEGNFFITSIELQSGTNYSTEGLKLAGRGIRATTFYSNTSRAIEILPSDGSGGTATAYNMELRDFSVRNGTTNPTNGILAVKLGFSQFHNINVSGFDNCIYLTGDSFLNRFTKIYMSGTHEYGFRMGGSGTTNYWDQCYDFGASVRGYRLTGDYSSIGSIAADFNTGDYSYDFSFFSGNIGALGNESSDVLRMITVSNSNISITQATAFGNTFDPSASKGGLLRGTGSTVKIDNYKIEQASSGATAITNVTQAASNPIVTSVGHGRSTGDTILFTDISGMTELNFLSDTITVTGADTFTLDNTDTSGFTAYTSGGTATLASTQAPIDMFECVVDVGTAEFEHCAFVGEPGGSSSDAGSIIVRDKGTGIAVGKEGIGRPYMGFDRGSVAFGNSDHRLTGTKAVPKAIFTDMVANPRYDTDGNDFNTGRPARVGDIFLESDPATNLQMARIISSTGSTLSACSSLRVPVEFNGTTAERPTGLPAGRRFMYFDDTLGHAIWWDGSGWVDASGSSV